MTDIIIRENIQGRILDIGAGVEGIIGRSYDNVIGIHNNAEELISAPDTFLKILMEPNNMQFMSEQFDTVTSFYTLMYSPKALHKNILEEAYRVLKYGGEILIWDVDIEPDEGDPLIVSLNVITPRGKIPASYGVYKYDSEQNLSYFRDLMLDIGFEIIKEEYNRGHFFLKARK